jgi:large subunit ribosomal protein L24
MQKIKKGDDVVVIAGRDKGKRGKVQSVDGQRVVVDGINIIKKHQRPVPARNLEGGIIERPASLHVSNVAILNPATSRPDRVGFRLLEDGVKVRIFKSTKEVVA